MDSTLLAFIITKLIFFAAAVGTMFYAEWVLSAAGPWGAMLLVIVGIAAIWFCWIPMFSWIEDKLNGRK